ncbi:P-loop containing nucleoside triphosphate hydrolase protein [Pelagophyceae sp. CCMP2097]|nr:P-loop containing nucleoside triphosphate hydrolase protein [Pelagophyceae sp. CCMP2097]
MGRPGLPIEAHRDALLYALETHPTLIVVGETGSGKSTLLPRYLLEAGWAVPPRCIAITQPRRVAATSLAQRVADDLGCASVGGPVGCAVRFDERWDPEKTRLKFVTDGWLLRECLWDPALSHYSVVVVDEAHERTVSTELLLGLLKKVQKLRAGQQDGLRVVVCSATLDVEPLRDFFGRDQTAVASIDGRQYPVDVFYVEKPLGADYVAEAARVAAEIHRSERPGDVLIFLPGARECDECVRRLVDELAHAPGKKSGPFSACTLYAALGADAQRRALQPAPRGTRKIVATTNIAETSLTVPGVAFVVDAGFARLPVFDAASGAQLVVTTTTSRATARQRAGRAGRTSHGKCFRLYTEVAFQDSCLFPDFTPPEMQRTDLTGPLLQLKALGIDNVATFDFASPPPAALVLHALEELRALGALDDEAKLTRPLGERLATAPCEPRLARALVAAMDDFGCAREVVVIAAALGVKVGLRARAGSRRNLEDERTKVFRDELVSLDGDHLTYVAAHDAFEAAKRGGDARSWCAQRGLEQAHFAQAALARPRLEKWLQTSSDASSRGTLVSCGGDTVSPRRALVAGFFARAAKLEGGTYRAIKGGAAIALDKSSVHAQFGTPPEYIFFAEYAYDDDGSVSARHASRVDPKWLLAAGDYYTLKH